MKKFIITTDEKVAARMIAAGFKMVSHIGMNYSFVNEKPENFCFVQDERKKIAFTNILSL